MRLHEFPHHHHQLLGSRCLASLSNIYFLQEIKQNFIENKFCLCAQSMLIYTILEYQSR